MSSLLLLNTFKNWGSLTLLFSVKLKSIKSVSNEINLVLEIVSQNISLCNCFCCSLILNLIFSSINSFFSSNALLFLLLKAFKLSYNSSFFLSSEK